MTSWSKVLSLEKLIIEIVYYICVSIIIKKACMRMYVFFFCKEAHMLKEFEIEIKEELARVVKVKAESLGHAIELVMEKYDKGEIVLNADDFVGKEIKSLP